MKVQSQLKLLLIESGLTEIEVAVYLDLLKDHAYSIFDLVKKTKLSKTSVYRAFENLRNLKLVLAEDGLIKAASLRCLIAELKSSQRKLGKLAYKIKKIAPFLRTPKEEIEVFDQFYTKEQITEAYLFMSEIKYDVSLDLGDFESFVPVLGSPEIIYKFRNQRLKNGASNHAICTSYGPYTSVFCTREAKEKFKNDVDILKVDLGKKFITFSDNSDYVLFNDFDDQENPSALLIKSKSLAKIQRKQFDVFSQLSGK